MMWWVRVILLFLHLCLCQFACVSAGHGKVYFLSRNFINTLHWEPKSSIIPGMQVLYTVQYKSDAKDQDQYKTKAECENIKVLSCDLTDETPSVPYVHYWAQVLANSRHHGHTTRFKPIAQTLLGAPTLAMYTTASSLLVNVTLPLGPKNRSIEEIFNRTKSRLLKTPTIYTLNITHPKWAARVNTSNSGQFVLHLKNNGTKYCGHVSYQPNVEWGRHRSENTSFCVTLQDIPSTFLPWILLCSGLLAVLAIALWLSIYCFVRSGKKSTLPMSLVDKVSILPSMIQPPDKNLFISKAELCPQTHQTVYSTLKSMPNVVTPGVYSPQDNGPTRTPLVNCLIPRQDTSIQSLENYAQVHIPDEESDAIQQDAMEGSKGVDSAWSFAAGSSDCGKSPLCPDSDVIDKSAALLLHAVRDTNGQLILPTLITQFNSMDKERKSLLSDLIDPREGGPLLSSLHSTEDSAWSDPEFDESTGNTPTQLYCNTHFYPSPVSPQCVFHADFPTPASTDGTTESGYKESWIPDVLLASSPHLSYFQHGKVDTGWILTNLKKARVTDEETETTACQNFLEDWMVHIQE